MVPWVAWQLLTVCVAHPGEVVARETWAVRHDEPSHLEEQPGSLLVDRAGNVYVAGVSTRGNEPDGSRSTLSKFDPAGRPLWSVEVDRVDWTPAVLSDPGGNLVLGGSEGIAKFDPDGRQVWALPRIGVSPRYVLRALAIDGDGNILTAGSEPERTAVVEKLDPLGNTLWRMVPGPGLAEVLTVAAIASDREGNVVLAGWLFNGRELAYLTLKLDPAGNTLWEARFQGLSRDEDRATSLAIDDAGNAFVGGTTHLLKYDPEGHELWRMAVGGVERIQLDSSGDLFAQGSFFAARVSPNGRALWTKVPDSDGFLASALDGRGNVYATSGRESVLKIDGWGTTLWEHAVENTGTSPHFWSLAVDPDDKLLISGVAGDPQSGSDRWTLKFDREGRESWRVRQNEPGNGDEAASTAVLDRQGDLFVFGDAFGATGINDFLTVKFSADGRKLWSVRHPFGGQESPQDIELSPDGDVVVSGRSKDLLTVKYDGRNGRKMWEAREPSLPQTGFGASSMTVDRRGNVWVSGGQGDRFPALGHVTTILYAPEGRRLWILSHGRESAVVRVAADSDRNGYVSSYGERGSSLTKISGDGRVLWQASLWNVAWDLGLDHEGFLYVAGSIDLNGTGRDIWVYKYDPANGLRLWEARYDGPAHGNDDWSAIILDRDGQPCIAGTSEGAGPFPSYVVVKLDHEGKRVWDARIPSRGRIEWGNPRIASSPKGGFIVCGYADTRPDDPWSTDRELEVLRLSSAGECVWRASRPGGRPRGHRGGVPAPTPVVDSAGGVFIAGTVFTPETDNDVEVIKYSTAPIPFLRGDCDGDGRSSGGVNDAIFLLSHLFAGGPEPSCPAACDANGDDRTPGSITDAIYLLRFSFLGGPPPPLPFPICGYDANTPFACENYDGC